VQLGIQGGFEYGGINVVVINFAALPIKRTGIRRRPDSGMAYCPL
jgi:hypothetical protein